VLIRTTIIPGAAVLVILAAILLISAWLLLNDVYREQQISAEVVAQQSNQYMLETTRLLEIIADTSTGISTEALYKLLAKTRENYPHFLALYIIDERGIVISEDTSLSSVLNLDFSGATFFKEVKDHLHVYYSDPFQSLKTEQIAILAATPIIRKGEFWGVLVAELNLELLQKAIEQSQIGNHSIAFILDRRGNTIAHPELELVKRQENMATMPLAKTGLTGKADTRIYRDPIRGFVIGSVKPVENNWIVIVTTPLLAAARPLVWLLGAALLAFGASLIIFLWSQVNSIQQIMEPIAHLDRRAGAISQGSFETITAPHPGNFREIINLNRSFERMVQTIQERDQLLEKRVRDRTQRLKIVATLGETINSILNLDTLLTEVVSQVKEQFGYYFVAIFLLDDTGEILRLREATGAGGQTLKCQHLTISLHSAKSLVARATRTGRVVNVENVLLVNDWLASELLPNTLSEIALPIIVDGKVIGVLDVQQDQFAAFDVSEIDMFRSLANEVGIAIHNARLYTEMEKLVADRTAELVAANTALKNELQERKQAEIALAESQLFSNNIIAATPGIVYIFNLAEKRITYINQHLSIALGYPSGALSGPEGTFWSTLLHPEDQQVVAGLLDRWQRAKDDDILFSEYRLKDTDGQWRWFQGRDKVFRRSDDGDATEIIGSAFDITEQKLAQSERELLLAQIQAGADQLKEVLNTVPEGVLLLEAGGKVLLANPQAESALASLTGASPGAEIKFLGEQTIEAFLAPSDTGLAHEIQSGYRTFEIHTRSLPNPHQKQQWLMVIHDVTQEREIQRQVYQQERLAAVGQLAAGIAHDFNNILAVILLYTEMALGAPDLSPKLHDRLITITQQSKRATELIQQILDFSRQAVLERRPMDLLPLVKEQVKLLERTLPENIRINLSYSPGTYTVDADPTRMQQMVMNLALNAKDAMPEGGQLRIELLSGVLSAHCTTCGVINSGKWVELCVEDTGAGIDEEVISRIFEPFFTTKTPGQGTGLGLAQVYGIVKQHNGHVDVITQPGGPTVFSIFLPALEHRIASAQDTDSGFLFIGKGQSILIVEDEAATRRALTDGLTLLNYHVYTTENGLQALEFLDQQPDTVRLILSDVIMPELGGIALFRTLRSKGNLTPFVLMTGHPMQDELEKLNQEGLNAWLLKPVRLKQMSETISRLLKPSI
jgi:PAS domain S-box-containing protein